MNNSFARFIKAVDEGDVTPGLFEWLLKKPDPTALEPIMVRGELQGVLEKLAEVKEMLHKDPAIALQRFVGILQAA